MNVSVQNHISFPPSSFLVVVVRKTWIPIVAKAIRGKLNMNCFGGCQFGKDKEYIALYFKEKPEVIDKLIGMFSGVPDCIRIDSKGVI